MDEELFLSDIMNFDELLDCLEEQIKHTLDILDVKPKPRGLKKELKELIKDTLKDEMKEYGWTGEEELPGVVSVNMFHEVFAAYNRRLYMKWFEINHEEAEEENPFTSMGTDKAINKLRKMYDFEDVELTSKRRIQEMKRGLQANLLSIRESLDYALTDEANVTAIRAEGAKDTSEVAKELEDILKETLELEERVNKVIDSIERLDYSTQDF